MEVDFCKSRECSSVAATTACVNSQATTYISYAESACEPQTLIGTPGSCCDCSLKPVATVCVSSVATIFYTTATTPLNGGKKCEATTSVGSIDLIIDKGLQCISEARPQPSAALESKETPHILESVRTPVACEANVLEGQECAVTQKICCAQGLECVYQGPYDISGVCLKPTFDKPLSKAGKIIGNLFGYLLQLLR